MDRVDCIVIGAGVVGLAIGRAIATSGRGVVVLESENAIGTGISARNSEVVHAGIYYDVGSLKARLCTEGRRMLYAYCDARQIAYRKTEKFIVGTQSNHAEKLSAILARAVANGVEDIDWIDARTACRAEPELRCTAALYSRQTGIVDSHGLMRALHEDIQDLGSTVVVSTPFVGATRTRRGWEVRVGGTDPTAIACGSLVNSAGLYAQDVAAKIDALDATHIPRRSLARGCYFSLAGQAPFTRLIYPVPVDGGLGVHVTLDLGGQARFGPDVEWIDAIDFTVDARRAERFYADVREYWPAMPDNSLQPAFAGIRPKLSGRNRPTADFVISGPREHGLDGLVNLFGIESPGLTASLAIGAHVENIVTNESAM